MTEEEQKLFRLYGKLPNKKDLLQNKLKVIHAHDYKLDHGTDTTAGAQVL